VAGVDYGADSGRVADVRHSGRHPTGRARQTGHLRAGGGLAIDARRAGGRTIGTLDAAKLLAGDRRPAARLLAQPTPTGNPDAIKPVASGLSTGLAAAE
jgi:hypothetical protein